MCPELAYLMPFSTIIRSLFQFSSQIARLIRDKEQEKERAEQRAIREAKRVCALIAKMVRDFWQNVDRVVDLHAQVGFLPFFFLTCFWTLG